MFKVRLMLMSIFASILGIGLACHMVDKPQILKPVAVKIIQNHGAGTAWAYRGYLITAAHVCQDEKELDIIINDHADRTKVLLTDKRADICILSPTEHMPLELKRGIETGVITQWGYPGFGLSIAKSKLERYSKEISKIGVFSGLEGTQAIYVHTYLMISGVSLPGMSGGPALNDKGEVVGLLTGGDGMGIVLLASIDNLDTLIDSL